MSEPEVIVEVLESIFGDHRMHNEGRGQITFDCPVCSYDIKGLDHGDGKGNLEVNYYRHVYKCWACSDTNDTHGFLPRLIKQYGTKQDYEIYSLNVPDTFKKIDIKYQKPKLPDGYRKFSDLHDRLPIKIKALKYLHKRGITQRMIDKYEMGVCVDGEFANRIIIPSYDKEKELNFFVGRSFVNHRLKYKNPQVPKDQIVFGESLIDWFKPVWLVEGIFDSVFIENSIPLLGKTMSDKLWEILYNNAIEIVVCLDEDAWKNGKEIFRTLNGGRLENKIKIIKLPYGKDIADLRGVIPDECWIKPEELWKQY